MRGLAQQGVAKPQPRALHGAGVVAFRALAHGNYAYHRSSRRARYHTSYAVERRTRM